MLQSFIRSNHKINYCPHMLRCVAFLKISNAPSLRFAYLLFWYHVFTCVSVSCSFAASSILSCTLRYFCRSKLFSRVWSWWSVNAVRALRCFLLCAEPKELEDELLGSSSLPPEIAKLLILNVFLFSFRLIARLRATKLQEKAILNYFELFRAYTSKHYLNIRA